MTKLTPTARQPLAGLEVIELSNMITCSLAAMTMALRALMSLKLSRRLKGIKCAL